jgi:hypothetical protein
MATIDLDLRESLEQLARTEPDTLLPFIVTVKPGVRADVLAAKGLRVEHEFPITSAITGKMTVAAALALAGSPDVEKIEYDGEMHALRRRQATGR